MDDLPSGKLSQLWKINILSRKLTIFMAILNSYIKLLEGISINIVKSTVMNSVQNPCWLMGAYTNQYIEDYMEWERDFEHF